jgi:hypothetical protein
LAAAFTYHRDHSTSAQSLTTKATPLKIDEPSPPPPQKVPTKPKDGLSAAEQNGTLERSPEAAADNSVPGLKETRGPKTRKPVRRAPKTRKNPTAPRATRRKTRPSAKKKGLDVAKEPTIASPSLAPPTSKPVEAKLSEPQPSPLPKQTPEADPTSLDSELATTSQLRILGRKGTRIQIDMAKVGERPLPDLALPPGRHSVWAELKGYEVQMLDLELKAGQGKVLQLKLKAIPRATLPSP